METLTRKRSAKQIARARKKANQDRMVSFKPTTLEDISSGRDAILLILPRDERYPPISYRLSKPEAQEVYDDFSRIQELNLLHPIPGDFSIITSSLPREEDTIPKGGPYIISHQQAQHYSNFLSNFNKPVLDYKTTICPTESYRVFRVSI